jgi:hypothetical protein
MPKMPPDDQLPADPLVLPAPWRVLEKLIRNRYNVLAKYDRDLDEWRLQLPSEDGGSEDNAYYTQDDTDALETAKAMREQCNRLRNR